MEFRCPSCKEITENEFINRIYNEMKYQCLGCRKEWKIIFVENKSDASIQTEDWHRNILEKSFPSQTHLFYKTFQIGDSSYTLPNPDYNTSNKNNTK